MTNSLNTSDGKNIVSNKLAKIKSVNNLIKDAENYTRVKQYLILNKQKFTPINQKNNKDLFLESLVDFDGFFDVDFEYTKSHNIALLENIIRDTYELGGEYTVKYIEGKNKFAVVKSDKIEHRYNGYSEEGMKQMVDMFISNIDYHKIIDKGFKNYITFGNDSSDEKVLSTRVRSFLEGGYKEVFKDFMIQSIINDLPNHLFSRLDDKIEGNMVISMVQFFYRKHFDDANNAMMENFYKVLEGEIDKKTEGKEMSLNLKLLNDVVKFDEILKGNNFSKKIAEQIYIKSDFQNFISEKYSKRIDFENNEIVNKIYEAGLQNDFGIKEIQSIFAKELDNLKLDKALAKIMYSKMLMTSGYGSVAFELSKLIFTKLKLGRASLDASKINSFNSNVKMIEYFDGDVVRGEQRPKFYFDYFGDIDFIDFQTDFRKKFLGLMEVNLHQKWNYKFDRTKIRKQDLYVMIKETFDDLGMSYKYLDSDNDDNENLVSEYAYEVFNFINSLSKVIIKYNT